jgi:DNA-binding PadR family transcriptional regulator
MYELVILGFLMRMPYHGYLIAKIINDMIGPFARMSNGRLYPLLAKLEQEGLISPAPEEAVPAPLRPARDRQHHSYQITEAGRQRFHELMMDTTSNPGEYRRIFWFKLPNLHWLEPAERLYLLDHYINFCQTHLFHLDTERRDLERKAAQIDIMSPEQLEASLEAMRIIRDQWQLELDSTRAWRDREIARIENLQPQEEQSSQERADDSKAPPSPNGKRRRPPV